MNENYLFKNEPYREISIHLINGDVITTLEPASLNSLDSIMYGFYMDRDKTLRLFTSSVGKVIIPKNNILYISQSDIIEK